MELGPGREAERIRQTAWRPPFIFQWVLKRNRA